MTQCSISWTSCSKSWYRSPTRLKNACSPILLPRNSWMGTWRPSRWVLWCLRAATADYAEMGPASNPLAAAAWQPLRTTTLSVSAPHVSLCGYGRPRSCHGCAPRGCGRSSSRACPWASMLLRLHQPQRQLPRLRRRPHAWCAGSRVMSNLPSTFCRAACAGRKNRALVISPVCGFGLTATFTALPFKPVYFWKGLYYH